MDSFFIGASNEPDALCPVAAVATGGAGSVLVALPWMKWFPELRERDRLA